MILVVDSKDELVAIDSITATTPTSSIIISISGKLNSEEEIIKLFKDFEIK